MDQMDDEYNEYQEFLKFKQMKQAAAQQTGNSVNSAEAMAVHEDSTNNSEWVGTDVYDKFDAPFIMLAFMPLLDLFFIPWPSISWIRPVVLLICNSIFVCMDISRLKRYAKINAWWLYTGFIIIPVYMFLRIAHTTKKYWPAIIWCVFFSIGLFLSFIR